MPDNQSHSSYNRFQHEYADVNGVRLHYVTAGTGKLILFLHGFPEFWYMWREQLAAFGTDHQAVAVDMRGYNLSSKPEGVDHYQIPILLEDIRALAEHLGHERFILVGHDWGGIVAWPFAATHSGYVEKLVIINAPHPAVFLRLFAHNADQQAASQYMLMFRAPQAERILSADDYAGLFNVLESGSNVSLSDEEKQKYIEAWSRPGALTGGLNYYRAMPVAPPAAGEKPSADLLAVADALPRAMVRVEVPTLVIWGEQDIALTTHNLDGLDQYIADLTVKRIPDASHWVVREQPSLVNTLIREFIH
jgi:pimeloyl-ACP methyl ester carboxylesterase